MYAKYARTARKTLQKMLTIKEITSIIMHHLPSIQIEDCGSVDLTAYRFRYALGFLLYHTMRKMSNAHSSANRQESITPTTHIKKESTPHGLLSFSFPKSCGFPTHSPPHHAAGNVSVISVPCSGSLLTEIVAWWRAAPCLTIDSPSPVPPTALEWLLSTR